MIKTNRHSTGHVHNTISIGLLYFHVVSFSVFMQADKIHTILTFALFDQFYSYFFEQNHYTCANINRASVNIIQIIFVSHLSFFVMFLDSVN